MNKNKLPKYVIIGDVEIPLKGFRPLVKKALVSLQDCGYCHVFHNYKDLRFDLIPILKRYGLFDKIAYRNIAPSGGKWGVQYVLPWGDY